MTSRVYFGSVLREAPLCRALASANSSCVCVCAPPLTILECSVLCIALLARRKSSANGLALLPCVRNSRADTVELWNERCCGQRTNEITQLIFVFLEKIPFSVSFLRTEKVIAIYIYKETYCVLYA